MSANLASEKVERVRLDVVRARELAERAMQGIGFEKWEAEIVADHAIDAALSGYEYSGLPKLLNIPESTHFSKPRRPVRVLKETPVSALMDGGNNNGMLAAYLAAREAISRAEAHGVALVAMTDAWMSGRSAYYVEMIARAGLVAIQTVASNPAVAAHGGAEAALGTNPIALAFPCDEEPLVIDMGTSAFMGTDLKFRKRLGLPLPDGVAVDEQGYPTTDAGKAQRGAILPFGGHKGFGLALAMHAFGALSSLTDPPAEATTGQLFIAFKPDLFMPLERYKRVLRAQIHRIKRTRRQPGVEAIRIPGERANADRRRLAAEGIEVDRRIVDALEALANRIKQ